MKLIETRICIDELETHGHSPAKFICSDGNMYYVKYRSAKSFRKEEMHCLAYEAVCSSILNKLNIPTPAFAAVKIIQKSIAPGQIKINKRTLHDGAIGFGSKEIENSDLVRAFEPINTLKTFHRLRNPLDLIKIAIFDLLVDNTDRKQSNFNLLIDSDRGKLKYYAIDHAFTFGGLKSLRIFHENDPLNQYNKLIDSQYFKEILKFISMEDIESTIDDFFVLFHKFSLQIHLDELFESIPHSWLTAPNLKERIFRFLNSTDRQRQVEMLSKKLLLDSKRRRK